MTHRPGVPIRNILSLRPICFLDLSDGILPRVRYRPNFGTGLLSEVSLITCGQFSWRHQVLSRKSVRHGALCPPAFSMILADRTPWLRVKLDLVFIKIVSYICSSVNGLLRKAQFRLLVSVLAVGVSVFVCINPMEQVHIC